MTRYSHQLSFSGTYLAAVALLLITLGFTGCYNEDAKQTETDDNHPHSLTQLETEYDILGMNVVSSYSEQAFSFLSYSATLDGLEYCALYDEEWVADEEFAYCVFMKFDPHTMNQVEALRTLIIDAQAGRSEGPSGNAESYTYESGVLNAPEIEKVLVLPSCNGCSMGTLHERLSGLIRIEQVTDTMIYGSLNLTMLGEIPGNGYEWQPAVVFNGPIAISRTTGQDHTTSTAHE